MVKVFLADGFEEIEALTAVDLLRRAEIETNMVSVNGNREVTGSHGIRVAVDELLDELDFDQVKMIVLPGGMPGTKNLEASDKLMSRLDQFNREERYIAAICAAPSILGHRGMLKGRKACSYPTFESHLEGAAVLKEPAVCDGHIITGRGMGCSIEFALCIVRELKGSEAGNRLAESIIYSGNSQDAGD